jgi:hypothetical protein
LKLEHLSLLTVLLTFCPAVYFAFFPGEIVLVTILCAYPLFFLNVITWRKVLGTVKLDLAIKLFFAYSTFIFIHGVVMAITYEDWVNLVSTQFGIFIILPTYLVFANNPRFFISFFKYFLIIGIPLSLVIFALTDDSGPFGFTHVISPIYFLILVIPFLTYKQKILAVCISIFSFFADLTIRANLVNILISYFLLRFHFVRKRYFFGPLKLLRRLFLMAPPIFLFLGLLGIFNVFQIGDYFEKYEISSNDGKVQDVLIDSRSQIYSDVFSQLNSDNALVFGLGASGKTKTHLTDIVYTDFDKVYKEGRRGTESGILNYIQFGGLLGGFFYFFLFLKGSYLAFYKSKNRFMVLFGTWVAFKAMNSFIEDSNIFSVSSVFLFLCIGLCYNEYLRNLSDEEVRALFRIKKLPIT